MDVNGTRFHLLYGEADWGRCLLSDSVVPLAEQWEADQNPPLEWDPSHQALRLTRQAPLFRQSRRSEPLDVGQRRGAGRDRYGNWYWIDPEERGIRFLPFGARQSVQWWSVDDLAASCALDEAGAFAACAAPLPPDIHLRGLAVTTGHYLLVGILSASERGLFLFDLHAGGAPTVLRWPDDVPFRPWDLAPTPDGGALVLDRDNLVYWRLDQDFRLLADVTTEDAPFQPTQPTTPRHVVRTTRPAGFRLGRDLPGIQLSPISIEAGPDGHVLILDTDPARPYSMIYEYQGESLVAEYSLEKSVVVADPAVGEGSRTRFSVIGHDFAYLDFYIGDRPPGDDTARARCDCPPEDTSGDQTNSIPFVYVAEQDGNQVLAFELKRTTTREGEVIARPDFLPLRRWEAKGLVAAGGQVWYDFADRWVTVQVFVECHYAGRAEFVTPLTFPTEPVSSPPLPGDITEVPGRPFDGGLPGCIWHRLLLDAEIPAGTQVTVEARAADDPTLLAQMGWLVQPTPYQRSDGAELPFYDPWAPRDPNNPVSEWTGTWELLFQAVRGRYLQLRLTLVGTGRSTPSLKALRAWYPRFSYAENYLPAIYREDPTPASLMDRFLANFEGFYTTLEEKIEHSAVLFDPRAAPVETLDWLACWFGLALDPIWDEAKRRFFIRHADDLFRRGTVPGVEIAVRLYLDCRVDDSLLTPGAWGRGTVRIVERYRTRGIGGLILGDTSDAASEHRQMPILLADLTPSQAATSAHRFAVLVPHNLSADDMAMVERIVMLEKPAHTDFELKVYYALFRVGEARLGIDTTVGLSDRFDPLRLGESYLPNSYLAAPYPFDIEDRFVVGR